MALIKAGAEKMDQPAPRARKNAASLITPLGCRGNEQKYHEQISVAPQRAPRSHISSAARQLVVAPPRAK